MVELRDLSGEAADKVLALINAHPSTPSRDAIAVAIGEVVIPQLCAAIPVRKKDRLQLVIEAIQALAGKSGSTAFYAVENVGDGIRLWHLAVTGWKPEVGTQLVASVAYGTIEAALPADAASVKQALDLISGRLHL